MSSIKNPDKLYSSEKNAILPGVLYLVATPIGNLSDLSERAIKTLTEVDFIAAEDTRNTAFLLSKIGIKKPLVSYYEHNKRERGNIICDRLSSGESCALVTDAGTPAISDPGEDLVALCIERNITITSVPGPCAAINALILSGLFTARFAFEGFLSANKSERRKRLEEVTSEKRTLIFYEAPHKLKQTLADMQEYFGKDRKIAICRELTKLNEEVIRTDIRGAIDIYSQMEPRGEYVIVVSPVSESELKDKAFYSDMSIEQHVNYYIENGFAKMDAMKAVAKDRRLSKSSIYKEINKK
ncbi:MAG: 16S rRNA (cytidine(1402)-2'-O)-methyltransferase [Ruminococcaceae bacterium]|nr:16S rRNA (cytidine(1402)-2'-O)-methyltransferase [Oscillospiraceae bacterium]